MAKAKREPRLSHASAANHLATLWSEVTESASKDGNIEFVQDEALRTAIRSSVNHNMVAYRFCLPTQLLGKATNHALDALALQQSENEANNRSWDARSFSKAVVAPFNHEQEDVLGTSSDPYVGNPMRIPRMFRDDPSKREVGGWNQLVEILETVEQRNSPEFTANMLRQVLLEMLRKQQGQRFTYTLPTRISLESTLRLGRSFLAERSGGDRALALVGALFDAIGKHFGLFADVRRGQINASDEATGLAADLECVNADGRIALAVEVKDRKLTLTDVEGTITKARNRDIHEVFFTAPGIEEGDRSQIAERATAAFAGGENLYVFDFFDLARSALALGGEPIRATFLRQVGEHLDKWNTQPRHRQAWQKLLKTV